MTFLPWKVLDLAEGTDRHEMCPQGYFFCKSAECGSEFCFPLPLITDNYCIDISVKTEARIVLFSLLQDVF